MMIMCNNVCVQFRNENYKRLLFIILLYDNYKWCADRFTRLCAVRQPYTFGVQLLDLWFSNNTSKCVQSSIKFIRRAYFITNPFFNNIYYYTI